MSPETNLGWHAKNVDNKGVVLYCRSKGYCILQDGDLEKLMKELKKMESSTGIFHRIDKFFTFFYFNSFLGKIPITPPAMEIDPKRRTMFARNIVPLKIPRINPKITPTIPPFRAPTRKFLLPLR